MGSSSTPTSQSYLPEHYFQGQTPVLVVMGVSGCGKTTISRLLAQALGWDLAEGDDFHSQANINKMAHGIPLTDQDRWPWLERIRDWIDQHTRDSKPAIVTCSALKRSYRDKLVVPGLAFVFLDGDYDTILARMRKRQGHYMKADMLCSQFETLEPPQPGEPHIQVGVGDDTTAQQSANTALQLLGFQSSQR
ncbi:gluconokinase [Bombiscardovia apis]|uniref:Gluconokinase n=1 Tax=Bombiscardovia apis TaxID=2932182 RepID=A0ABM8BE91_9BIFI|nr:gluconokinase [Bombiscardovia apis]BDR55249.1 gluconokinase [Bombiscardovia apis]